MGVQYETESDYEDIRCTIVGLYCPDYMGDLNTAGWHFHFINEDRTRGGHVLQVSVGEAEAAFDMTDGFEMTLSRDAVFQDMELAKDVDEAIHQAETATTGKNGWIFHYRSASFMLVADDDMRDCGNPEKAAGLKEKWEAAGYHVISMANDWKTVYGEEVVKTGEFLWLEELAEDRVPVDSFYITEITDEIFDRIYGKSFKEDCTLPREELRYLHVLHRDLDGNIHEGEMIVNRHIAEDVLEILRQLYEADYPIERIRLVDEYDADDEASMEDNNSSAFNFRFISHTTRVSKHGLGLAVDINTLYNPYTKIVHGERMIEPINGEPYLDRDADFPYKIDESDLCYKLFIEHGFEWGGAWEDRKDYQHFEIPDGMIAEWYPENQS